MKISYQLIEQDSPLQIEGAKNEFKHYIMRYGRGAWNRCWKTSIKKKNELGEFVTYTLLVIEVGYKFAGLILKKEKKREYPVYGSLSIDKVFDTKEDVMMEIQKNLSVFGIEL